VRPVVPGDPQGLSRSALVLARAAGDLADQDRALRRGSAVATSGWLGAAALAFDAAAGGHAGRVVHAQRTVESLGAAIRAYSTTLEALQRRTSSLLGRRRALTEELRAARRQAAAGGATGTTAQDLSARIRRLDDDLEESQRQASAARRTLTAALDDLRPRPTRRVPPRPGARAGCTSLPELAAGGAVTGATAWQRRIPTVPVAAGRRAHCGPVRPVLTNPFHHMRTGPVGPAPDESPGHRMQTGPVSPAPDESPGHRMQTGPVGPAPDAPGRRVGTGPVGPLP